MRILTSLLLGFIIFGPQYVWGAGDKRQDIFLKTEEYLVRALGQSSLKPHILWITGDIRTGVKRILQRSNFPLRYRYYRNNNRTVWILDEIGKTLPITTGITIEDGRIIDLTVLIYRESHGSEIRYPAYSDQFTGARLTEKLRLSKPVNGISGATLSTNAMKKISRLALFLHKNILDKNAPKTK